MPKLLIKCPTCGKLGNIEVENDIMKDVSRGLLTFKIIKDTICSHSFIIYIDKNFNIRDYIVADFQIELPKFEINEKIEELNIILKDKIDIDLIKLNLSATLLSFILKSIFSKVKIVLISDKEFLYEHISNFYKYVTQNSFNVDISLLSEESYKKNKRTYKDSVVFKNNTIINDNKKIIDPKKIHVEKLIINKFLTEKEPEFSFILLKNEIQKVFQLSKSIVNFINGVKKIDEKINILKIKTQLEELYKIKLNELYLNFLIDIVKNYFKLDIPSYGDSLAYYFF